MLMLKVLFCTNSDIVNRNKNKTLEKISAIELKSACRDAILESDLLIFTLDNNRYKIIKSKSGNYGQIISSTKKLFEFIKQMSIDIEKQQSLSNITSKKKSKIKLLDWIKMHIYKFLSSAFMNLSYTFENLSKQMQAPLLFKTKNVLKRDIGCFLKDVKELQREFRKEMKEKPGLRERIQKIEEEDN